jgi:hypothetical protein
VGLANSFLAGSKEEWSLVRRHPSEKIFGVQIAGSKIPSVVSAAEVLAKECGSTIDFVDLNCGCPVNPFPLTLQPFQYLLIYYYFRVADRLGVQDGQRVRAWVVFINCKTFFG